MLTKDPLLSPTASLNRLDNAEHFTGTAFIEFLEPQATHLIIIHPFYFSYFPGSDEEPPASWCYCEERGRLLLWIILTPRWVTTRMWIWRLRNPFNINKKLLAHCCCSFVPWEQRGELKKLSTIWVVGELWGYNVQLQIIRYYPSYESFHGIIWSEGGVMEEEIKRTKHLIIDQFAYCTAIYLQ